MAKKKAKRKKVSAPAPAAVRSQEVASVADLKPHPRNYRRHPDDQIDHLVKSIQEFGFYRNVVVAKDNTILAGHGVVQAMKRMGRTEVPVVRLPLAPDDPRALKLLAGDNEIARTAEADERSLADLLSEVSSAVSLEGTGFDEESLAKLVFMTRRPDELGEWVKDHQREWAGMPEFKQEDKTAFRRLIVNFQSQADVEHFANLVGQTITEDTRSIWHPKAEIDRLMDKRYGSE